MGGYYYAFALYPPCAPAATVPMNHPVSDLTIPFPQPSAPPCIIGCHVLSAGHASRLRQCT
ncbi:hypothetical protein [Thiobacillus sp.]|uniref:hypothetical protein n=1 Tax=Thiobacillus sp. TaxID=924 RepID=UPI00286E6935|nr:hypothetical protein [Thiobacillus sp.]